MSERVRNPSPRVKEQTALLKEKHRRRKVARSRNAKWTEVSPLGRSSVSVHDRVVVVSREDIVTVATHSPRTEVLTVKEVK